MRWFIGVGVLFFTAGFLFCLIFVTSCTYSVIMNHTEGEATDMVDESQSASPDVKADINIPKMPIPPFGVDLRKGQRI